MKDTSFFNLHPPAEMAKIAEQMGLQKINKKKSLSFILAVTAGVFISVAFTFYVTTTTGVTAPNSTTKLVGGLCFTLGLILVVVCGAELFTSTVLTVIAKASGLVTWRQLVINWIVVYFGNMVGAFSFVLLIWFSGQIFSNSGLWGLNVLQIANHKMQHTFFEAVCLGMLCNLMVCLAVWLSYAGHSLTDKMFAMFLPVSMFVASGFEHSIANMFMIPLAIVIRYFAPENFWNSTITSADHFPALTFGNFLTDNLIPVTLGNIIGGGLIVGLTYWWVYLKNQK